MIQTSAFKTPKGEAAYLEAYEVAMKLWPVPYEEFEIPTRFGMTHVVASGPGDGPPVVLLHGYLFTLNMWSPNIADFSTEYRVYAVDVMGQPGKSVPDPDEPIRETADFVAWLNQTLDGLNLDRISLVGMSHGGWVALNFAKYAPERVQKLILLSPAASFQPFAKQFVARGMAMLLFPSRLTVNSLMAWAGIKETPGDTVIRRELDLVYLGTKYFRMAPETSRIPPTAFSDDELRVLRVPVLLLIGDHEAIYDPAKAMARARALIPDFRGELVPGCSHDMCFSQHQIVDLQVLDFLNGS